MRAYNEWLISSSILSNMALYIYFYKSNIGYIGPLVTHKVSDSFLFWMYEKRIKAVSIYFKNSAIDLQLSQHQTAL